MLDPKPVQTQARIRVVYIAGSGRSGSTILDRILGQLDGFFSVGELVNLWERGLVAARRCGCGVPVPECPLWSAVLARGFGAPGSIDAGRMVALGRRRVRPSSVPRLLAARGRTIAPDGDEYRTALARLYRAVHEHTGCRVIVDSSKSPAYAELLATLPGVEVFVVHLVRDPRATAYSWRRQKRLPDFGDDRLMLRQPPLVSARRWILWQTTTELLWRRRPDRYLRLRYEDVVEDPRSAVLRIAALVNQSPQRLPFTSDRIVRLGATHSVSGNPNRFGTGEVELAPDTEWMGAMRGVDWALVTAATWPWLLRYNYRLRRRRQPRWHLRSGGNGPGRRLLREITRQR
jgi:Sulfotransferase family